MIYAIGIKPSEVSKLLIFKSVRIFILVTTSFWNLAMCLGLLDTKLRKQQLHAVALLSDRRLG